MNRIDQRISDLHSKLKCLAREVCSLSEGEGETDPIFSASPAFGISAPLISDWNDAASQAHFHSNLSALNGISLTRVGQWDAAYTISQDLPTTYFPLTGGTLTGAGGQGFVGFPDQTSVPSNPASGFKLYSDNTGRINFLKSNGVVSSISTAGVTTSRVFVLPDVAGTFVLDAGDQTIAGNKTFTGTNTTIGASTLTGNVTLTGSRTIGTTGNPLNILYAGQIFGTAHMLMGTTAALASGSLSFVFGGTTTYVGGFFTTTGNFFVQNSSATKVTDNSAGAQFTHSKNASSGLARGMSLINTLTATANNDVLVALDISTTFTNGAFTGNSNLSVRTNGAIRIGGDILNDSDGIRFLGSSVSRYSGIFLRDILKASASNAIRFGIIASNDFYATFQPTTHNFVLQSSGAIGTDTGERLQVLGTSLLNGLVTLGAGLKLKTTSSGAVTLSIDTTNVVYTGTGTTSTWTLLPLSGNTGLFYILANRGSGNITLNSNAGGNDIWNNGTAVNSITLLPNDVYRIVHNGTSWIAIAA